MKNLYNLTNPQKSILYTEEFFKNTTVNNIGAYVHIKSSVNFDILKKAVNEVIRLNDSMRIKLNTTSTPYTQYVESYEKFDIDIINLPSISEIDKFAKKITSTLINIEDSILFKFILFRLPNNEGGVIINIHHIISDSWTLGLISTEIINIYSEMKNNKYSPVYKPSYLKFIESEKEYLNSNNFEKDKLFWKKQFNTIPEIASIPSSQNNLSNNISCNGNRKTLTLDKELVCKIKNYCKSTTISLYNFFMSVYSLYIGSISNLNDFVIGTPILNRSNFEQKHTTGVFISIVPLRVNLDYNLSFNSFVKNISFTTMSILRHQKYPYLFILEDLRKNFSKIPNLYNIVLSYQITKSVDTTINLEHSTQWLNNGCCADDLQIHLSDFNDKNIIDVSYDFKVDKYDEIDIINIHTRILNIINQVLENSEILLKNIEIVTPIEKHKILYEFNNTTTSYPKDKTIIALFEEQVSKTPNNIAVVFENDKLTYNELNKKANILANYLHYQGIKNNDVVGLFFDKSLESIVSILAILKCGAIYMPIDINYPIHRIDFMINDTKCNYILSTNDLKPKLSKYSNVLCVDLKNFDIYKSNNLSEFNLNNVNISSENLAYIMYTSGSTGNPKGVMVSNRNIIRLVKNINYLKFNENDRILQTGSIVFDACTFEIWTSLLNRF